MKRLAGLVVGAALAAVALGGEVVPPERLEARKAFAELKFGIFLHWGLYSTFAQGEWYLGGLKVPGTNDRVQVVRLMGLGVARGCIHTLQDT